MQDQIFFDASARALEAGALVAMANAAVVFADGVIDRSQLKSFCESFDATLRRLRNDLTALEVVEQDKQGVQVLMYRLKRGERLKEIAI